MVEVLREAIRVSSQHPLAGVAFATASAFSFSLLNVVVRFSEPYLSVWQMMFARSVFGLVMVALLARWSGINLWGRGRKTLVGIGFTNVANVLCLTSAIFLLPLFEALILLYFYPVFAALISPTISGDHLEKADWGIMALGLLGMTLVLWPGQLNASLSLGHALGLAAAFCYGLTTTLIRRAVKTNHNFVPFFYVCLVGCLVCGPVVFWQQPIVRLPAEGWGALLALSVFGAAAYLFSNKALEFLSSPKVGVISMSEVAFSSFFGLILFGEQLGWLMVLGGGLILISGVLLSFKTGRLRRHLL
ncbi:MAG: DMT family transporter [Desulfuromonadales bacterium]|jgi:drug/metabolite transporter (DMT)-like permease